VAWLALIVSLVALFFSWKAYERSGGRVGDVLNTQVEVGDESPPDWRAALDEAREKLDRARETLNGDDVAQVREKLARAFENAGEGARRSWRGLDRDLEHLQTQVERGGSRAK
jgi:hypothetical protein